MTFSRTCKMLGIVLDENVAQESYRIIKEALERKPFGLPGEIRTSNTPTFVPGISHLELLASMLVSDPGDFWITGVELVNNKQLQFETKWTTELSEEAIEQLYIVPAYVVADTERQLVAFYAKVG